MKVLLVSSAVSSSLQKHIFEKYGLSLGFAIQKYYRLMQRGLIQNGVEVEALSLIPIPKAKAPFIMKFFHGETEGRVRYSYLPYFKNALVNHAFVVICLFFRVLWWSIRNRKDSFILCDILIPSVCIGTFWGSAVSSLKKIAWVTDMPGMSSKGCIKFDDMGLVGKLQIKSIRRFSGFIFSTLNSNSLLNPRNRPYAVLDGFVDEQQEEIITPDKSAVRGILYAGGIVKEYGIEALCEAFTRLPQEDIRLIVYGEGDFVPHLLEYALKDSRIEYRGMAQNEEIVQAEKSATLLVNPRFSNAEYTLYSFPSKNIEYMVSGTPLVTTRLPGIPEDHYSYVYTFDEETPEAYCSTLNHLLSKSADELISFGARARSYILSTRNTKRQVEKVLNLVL